MIAVSVFAYFSPQVSPKSINTSCFTETCIHSARFLVTGLLKAIITNDSDSRMWLLLDNEHKADRVALGLSCGVCIEALACVLASAGASTLIPYP